MNVMLSIVSGTKCHWRDIIRIRGLLLQGLVCCVLCFLANATWWVSYTGVWGHPMVLSPDLCPPQNLPQWSCCLGLDLATVFLGSSRCRFCIGQGRACRGALTPPLYSAPILSNPVSWKVISHGFPSADTTHSRLLPTVALWYPLILTFPPALAHLYN